MKSTIIMILRGLPGTGKDTYLKSLAKSDGLKIATCSADDHFMQSGEYVFNPAELTAAHDACFRRFIQLCQSTHYDDSDLDVIAVSNTNTCLFEMSPYLMYARYEGVDIEIVEIGFSEEMAHEWGSTVPEMCAKRNVHGVPIEGIQAMYKRWEQVPPFWSSPTKVESRPFKGEFFIDDARLEEDDRTIPVVR